MDELACVHHQTVIVGTGVAGLFTALKLAPHPVTVITAADLGHDGSSTWAQGGVAAAMGEDDCPALHVADTMTASAGLGVEKAIKVMAEASPKRVHDLLALGVPFDHYTDGRLKLGHEAAHCRRRIVHASGDQAGAHIMRILSAHAQQEAHINIVERSIVEDIVTSNGRAVGVLVHDIRQAKRYLIYAHNIILATGGVGGVFAVTTNPLHAQGHGLAMAYRAGATIIDPEFIQFHPTALDVGGDPAPLASEALRGAGAVLVDAQGQRFMTGHHKDAELAPRDIVARGVAQALAGGQGAFLDASKAIGARFAAQFPTIYAAARKAGLDPSVEKLPIIPAAHYHMGGVGVDLDGRTDLPGLWAVGEVASTGVHGANRLASNSLVEAFVWGARCATAIGHQRKHAMPIVDTPPVRQGEGVTQYPARPASKKLMAQLRPALSRAAGILRTHMVLEDVQTKITTWRRELAQSSGDFNSLLAAEIIITGALARQESRGAHARLDYPACATMPLHTRVKCGPNGHPHVASGAHPVQS